ncbi:MAG: cytochrome c oxidase accessory protein CcoG [Bacteriovoracaceae bacterium]|nr:cytochrome c oxidase accessory protein CcoG [Bacteriovoracaceae bacterium]
MSKNRFDIDNEKLATTDEHGNRIYLHTEDVKGKWKDRRTLVYWGLILLYLILPWIYINGKPALMVNIFKREFTFFGSTLFGVEPILFFLIIISGLFFIAFLTSVFGRVWCGWACPQTVFIQSLFLKIESFIEGSARERRALEQAPMSVNKFSKKILKWGIFTLISMHIAHTFVGYFVGPRELFLITMNSPLENFGIFSATMFISAIFLLDFGWFREQFCIIACPYGRMQAVMMDESSLVVAYDTKRGEPRRGSPGIERTNEGDCINCYNCVKVCPTGIDIRNGTQMECIACTMCIDACDDIMIKLKRPEGLIRYSSENELNGIKQSKVTPRSLVYAAICFIFIGAFIYFLNQSTHLKMFFIRGSTPYSTNNSEVTNKFDLKFNYQGTHDFKLILRHQDQSLNDKIQIVTPVTPIILDKHEKKVIVFFRFDRSLLSAGTKNLKIEVFDLNENKIVATQEVNLVGPTH